MKLPKTFDLMELFCTSVYSVSIAYNLV